MTWQQFKQAYLIKFWAPAPAVIAAGILSTYYFGITGTFWAVTGEFTRWGGQLLQLAGVHTEQWGYFKLIHLEGTPLTRIDGMMIIGMFGGCFAAALWANNIKLRLPRSRIRIIQAVAGGIIAGFGARLAMAATWQPFLPVFLSFPSTPGSLPSRRYRDLVWRTLYATAPVSNSGQDTKSFCGLAAHTKAGAGAASFSRRNAGVLRHDRLGITDCTQSA